MTRTKVWRAVAIVPVVLLTALTAHVTARTTILSLPLPPPPAVAPPGLTAMVSNAKVTLTWSSVDGATAYRVFWRSGSSATSVLANTSYLSLSKSSLVNGTTYFFSVAATNKGGVGPSSAEVSATPFTAPTGVVAAAGDQQVAISWQAAPGATGYHLYRSLSSTTESLVAIATNLAALSYLDSGLTNGTKYYYRVQSVSNGLLSGYSALVYAKPLPPPPADAPANLAAAIGNARVTLTWNPVANATSYRIFRSEQLSSEPVLLTTTTATTFKNTGLVNDTTYRYQVAGRNMGGDGPRSEVVATPIAPPSAPADVAAVAADHEVTLSWTASPAATSYNVYRGTQSNRQATTPIATGILASPFVDAGLTNGPTYFYKVTALNAGGASPKSLEASASPEGPPPVPDPAVIAAFRLLRQTTWGPKPGDVDALMTGGVDAFLADQFAASVSQYPDSLFMQPTEMTQEHFMHLALTGPDQLRQRVAWALHKIWVVSAVEVPDADAIVTYQRILMNGAFGNYRDLMNNITLNPAMGRYLNMLNNRSQAITGALPNENYARELMQLFTEGIPTLNPNGTPVLNNGAQVPVYTEQDVKELARIFTGWTFGDGNPTTVPRRLADENWRVPMEAVVRYHDAGAKTFLGQPFAAGQSAQADLQQALDILFNHPNVGPFVSKQLIQQLVTSNPSPAYVAAVASVFNDNGAGVRGDLAAVVRAVLTHPEAGLSTDSSGKLSEPVLFVVSMLRALNASVTDHPFMSDKAEEMGQKVFYPPSVFSYFSPGYRVRGTTLGGPEFQILTSVTALVRVNFAALLLGGSFGANVSLDYTPFTSRASDPAALVDYCSVLFMGGRMSLEQRTEVIAAVRASANSMERARTALYLTLAAAQGQVDR